MAFLARISGRCGLLAGRRTSRHFCFDNINFSRANIAFKIAMPNNRVVMQFNFQDESFQVDLDSSCSLNELRQALIEKGTCQ